VILLIEPILRAYYETAEAVVYSWPLLLFCCVFHLYRLKIDLQITGTYALWFQYMKDPEIPVRWNNLQIELSGCLYLRTDIFYALRVCVLVRIACTNHRMQSRCNQVWIFFFYFLWTNGKKMRQLMILGSRCYISRNHSYLEIKINT